MWKLGILGITMVLLLVFLEGWIRLDSIHFDSTGTAYKSQPVGGAVACLSAKSLLDWSRGDMADKDWGWQNALLAEQWGNLSEPDIRLTVGPVKEAVAALPYGTVRGGIYPTTLERLDKALQALRSACIKHGYLAPWS